ncbi:MAG TPA: metal-sensitive transcriptional regulator [Chthoniobacterales bacterium]
MSASPQNLSRQIKKPPMQKVKARVNRIAGQVGGIQRMIDEGKYCVDILNQIAAVRSALDALGIEMLTHHLEGCVMSLGTGRDHARAKSMSRDQLLAEVQLALSRFLR